MERGKISVRWSGDNRYHNGQNLHFQQEARNERRGAEELIRELVIIAK